MQHSVQDQKIKDTQLAKMFNISTQTLRNWKREDSPIELKRRYQALKEFYSKQNNLE